MGDLRDQLKKIKNALGLSRPEKKSSRPVVGESTPSKSGLQVRQKGQQSHVTKAETVQRLDQKSEKSNDSSPNEKISGTIASNSDTKRRAEVHSSNSLPPVPAGDLSLPVFTSRARASEFKMPDVWVSQGVASQIATIPEGRRNDIFIGLDFGTAFTKAAVQILDNIYPVDWNGVANLSETFLLPTEYSEIENRACYLGQHPNVLLEGLHANLKHSFINQRVSGIALAKASVFVALVLQYIRAWTYHHHGIKLGSAPIGWYFNIGIPSDVLDKDRHAQNYKKLADIAWTLSLRPQSEITFENAFQAISRPAQRSVDLLDVSTIPELVAQLSGYSKSSARENGLHVLIDIGGGTVDMVTFNVHQADGDDVFPFFVSNVKPLGSFALLENRLSSLSKQTVAIESDVQNLLIAKAFAKFAGCSVSLIDAIDKKFLEVFKKEFQTVLSTTYRRRYPSSPNWKLGIRTFISGGGAFIPGYKDSIRNCGRPANCPLLTMDLPPHPKLAKFDQNLGNYSRLSVACGLAVDSFSLGAIRPASEVDDATPLITTVNGLPVRERPDRDELYPK